MTVPSGRTAETVRWVAGLVVAGLVAYFSAMGVLQAQLAVITERETNHYQELIKRLDRLEMKIDTVR
ncbi:MAG: hypothetical protein AB7Q16_05940 [Vicinamibacterales bacterium]